MQPPSHHVAAFYRFVALDDLRATEDLLRNAATLHQVIGTVLVAHEGINGTVAASTRAGLESFFAELDVDRRLRELPIKWSTASRAPFNRMRVKQKREIVPLGRPGIDPTRRVGRYVPPKDWNQLLDDPELVLVDARNDFEVRIGAFEGAIDPKTRDFRQLASWAETNLDPERHKKVAMYCTGGIRCEKATAFLLEAGFEQVFHLEGGILAYLEQVPEEESRFQGACFVFDQRVSLEHGLREGGHLMCPSCGEPFEAGARCSRC